MGTRKGRPLNLNQALLLEREAPIEESGLSSENLLKRLFMSTEPREGSGGGGETVFSAASDELQTIPHPSLPARGLICTPHPVADCSPTLKVISWFRPQGAKKPKRWGRSARTEPRLQRQRCTRPRGSGAHPGWGLEGCHLATGTQLGLPDSRRWHLRVQGRAGDGCIYHRVFMISVPWRGLRGEINGPESRTVNVTDMDIS